jgi:hypothetical protein
MQITKYGDVHAYVSSDMTFPGQRAGTNDSHLKNYINNSVWDAAGNLRFRNVLPWGHGRDHIINYITLDRKMELRVLEM